VIIDLEDAVAAEHKSAARTAAVRALEPGGIQALVRVNAAGTDWVDDDLAALTRLGSATGHGLVGVMVPKAGDPAALAVVAAATQRPVVALVESARGVTRARELAAVPGVERLAFGALDLAYDLGSDVDALTGQVARAEVVIASRAAGLPGPFESPSTELRDLEQVEATTRSARMLGFAGRLCIHPGQLAAVRAGFAPTAEEVSWARGIAGAGAGVERVDDQMVDRPVLERARRILRLVGEL
jgi:citrate lyase subunit beta/citryl-CoA lyase